MFVKYINKVLNKQHLTPEEMIQALSLMIETDIPVVQIASFLTALRMKGESSDELLGGARFLRSKAVFINSSQQSLMDIVGTGGDGSCSFNISTTSSFVIAGAGIPVAKHGNRAATSLCGSADVLEALGYHLEAPTELIEYAIAEYGIGFLYARKMHPILGKVAGIRKELKIRTIFNMLGPLANPINTDHIVLGVYDPSLTELFAQTLLKLNMKRAMVVCGMDGLDEISCCAPTRVSELKDGVIRTFELLPELLLGTVVEPKELLGGDAKKNADILRSVLEGKEQGGPRLAVLLNAGAAIYTYGKADSLQEGIKMAQQSIDTGAAMEKLNRLIEVSHG